MQIKLGEKIRELRRRDGRTQEALASALGMSTQAVSRWEANGGYPDMELIPRIANYFHISIDELFGYDGDRRDKIEAILARADEPIRGYAITDKCIAELREAMIEFPDEPQILLRLGYALSLYGEKHHGARRLRADGPYPVNDTAYNAENPYFKEALILFEKVLDLGIEPDDRKTVLPLMVMLYGWMGNYERAEELARERDPVTISREYLLSAAVEGEKRDEYQGSAISALSKAVSQSVHTKQTIDHAYAASVYAELIRLHDLIFSDGNFGEHHAALRELCFWCAAETAGAGDLDTALVYFDRAFEHSQAYASIQNDREFTYTAPLISRVQTTVYEKWPIVSPVRLPGIRMLPDDLRSEIEKNPKYAEYTQK